MKEQLLDPLTRFMNSPQKAIYDAARKLVNEQEDNFAYLPASEVEPIKAVLSHSAPYKGNLLQQVKPLLNEVQQGISAQLATEKATATLKLEELEQRLRSTNEFSNLESEQQATLTAPFAQTRQTLQNQQRIAMIRDQLRSFEETQYPQLLIKLNELAEPVVITTPVLSDITTETVISPNPPPATTDKPATKSPRMVPARSINVNFNKPWLSSEDELNAYLEKLRQALLKEIQAGNRVQI